jgi:polar amino acid transport system substrate-binding protein
MSRPATEVVSQLAPTGTLRAAINYGNAVLAARDPASGELSGVSVDLARELARRLSVPVAFTAFPTAGRVVDAVKTGTLDVMFLAIDPLRANEIDYTAAYVLIEGAYAVRAASPIRANAQVDSAGVRVVVGRGSAYDLHLTRELKAAQIVRVPDSQAVVPTFLAQGLEVAAGVRQQLEADLQRTPGLRLLDGRFMAIHQAMGTPKGRAAGAAYLAAFVEEMKSSGFVAQALARHRIEGALVAPAGR